MVDLSEGRSVQPRQLIVDVSVIAIRDSGTGIQRVVRSIWLALAEMEQREQLGGWALRPVVATLQIGYHHAPRNFLAGGEIPWRTLDPVDAGEGDIVLFLDLAPSVVSGSEAQLASWKGRGARLVFLVYDLLAMSHPRWFTRRARRNITRWFETVSRLADHCICISDVVAGDVRCKLACSLAAHDRSVEISRLPLGADILPSGSFSKEAMKQEGVSPPARPFALMVGTVEPRKAHKVVLAAFDRRWRGRKHDGVMPDLVIVGRPGWRTRLLQWRLRWHPEQGKRLHWLVKASDDALVGLYRNCSLVIQASYAEGFGLPVVEALAHGAPVLARDIPIFREVGGANIAYFKSDDPVELGEAICNLIGEASNDRLPRLPAMFPGWRQCTENLLRQLGVIDHAGSASSEGF